MTHLTIELEENLAEELKAIARTEGLNSQQWIEKLVRRHVHPQWPEHVKALAGAWPDFPTADELRQNAVQDTARETL